MCKTEVPLQVPHCTVGVVNQEPPVFKKCEGDPWVPRVALQWLDILYCGTNVTASFLASPESCPSKLTSWMVLAIRADSRRISVVIIDVSYWLKPRLQLFVGMTGANP